MKSEIINFFKEGNHLYLLEILNTYRTIEDFFEDNDIENEELVREFLEDTFGYENEFENLTKYIKLYYLYFEYKEITCIIFDTDSNLKLNIPYKIINIISLGDGDIVCFGTNEDYHIGE